MVRRVKLTEVFLLVGRRLSILLVASMATMCLYCRESRKEEPTREIPAPAPSAPAQPEPETTKPVDTTLEWAKTKAELEAFDDPDRWLTVTRGDPEKPGAWATGRYDQPRNRLEITTRDALEFTVDVGGIPIDWTKLVVLRIDDRNTELKRREQSVYRFVRGSQGQWEVRE